MIFSALCISGSYDALIASLALSFCIVGALITTSIVLRYRDTTKPFKGMWLVVAGIASGATTWCSHFIAMQSFLPGVELGYDAILTTVSLLLVVYGSKAAFWIALNNRSWLTTVLGGLILGGSVATMHYTGMAAVSANAIIGWSYPWMVASIIVCLGFGIATMVTVVFLSGAKARILGTISYALTVIGVHSLAMIAYRIQPLMPLDNEDAARGLALFIMGVGILVVLPALIADRVEDRANREAKDKLLALALVDQLTGLPNRATVGNYLDERIEEIAGGKGRLAIFTIDLSHFRDINELRGYPAGDTVLKTVAQRLRDSLGPEEFVARTGADEFLAIKRVALYVDQKEVATAFAERLHTIISQPIELGDDAVRIGANMGIAFYPEDGATTGEVLGYADMAVRRVKSERKHFMGFFSRLPEDEQEERNLVEEMRRAMTMGQFELIYEPQLSVRSGKIEGYAARVIWNHPELGTLKQAQFIPQAEETGMILAIRKMVLHKACTEAAKWMDGASVSVRLSPKQIDHVDVVSMIDRTLRESGLAPSLLEIEVDERMFADMEKRNLDVLAKIRRLGVKLALTRFGREKASLSCLGEFPFDRIGIDPDIVQGMPNDLRSRMVVSATISAARQLGTPVLADGIETDEQKEAMIDAGCAVVQGKGIAPPREDGHYADVINSLRSALLGEAPAEDSRSVSLGGRRS